jgi:O-antigen ligase
VPLGLLLQTLISSFLLSDEEYSLSTRTEAWRVLWQLVERSPILGTGPANYYYYTENFPLLGWYVRFISHNNYQDLMIQTGLAGLLAFAWFAFELLLMMLRLYPQVPEGFGRAYVVGALGGLAGSLIAGMLGDWIIPFYYNAGILGFRSSLLFWVFLGGILALKRMITEPAPAAEPRPRPIVRPRRARRGLAEAH